MSNAWRKKFHITLGRCSVNMMARYTILGAPLMHSQELLKVKQSTLLQFVRTTKRFFISLGQTDEGLSTEWVRLLTLKVT